MTVYVGGGQAWKAIGDAVRKAKGEVAAAVGYIGIDGPDVLPLQTGDLLVCDASDRAVRNGSTHPHALERYIRRGVAVYSYPGLHAKVIVLPRRVFVGSANASKHSRDCLEEAVFESTDALTRQRLRQWIDHLALANLNLTDVAALGGLVPKRTSTPPATIRASTLPRPLAELRIEAAALGPWSSAAQRVFARDSTEVKHAKQATSKNTRLDVMEWPGWHLRRLTQGSWISYVLDGKWVYGPAQVFHRSYSTGGSGLLWLTRPKLAKTRLPVGSVRNALISQGLDLDKAPLKLTGKGSETIAQLFR